MVASDTVVGLVGAGILLVALVGVFIVESQDSSKELTLEPMSHNGSATGTVKAWDEFGPRDPVNMDCLPGDVFDCGPPFTDVAVALTGLPILQPRLSYVTFLTKEGSTEPINLGALSLSGSTYGLDYNQSMGDRRAWTTFVVTLENSTLAAAPSSLVVYSKVYGAFSGAAEAAKALDGDVRFNLTAPATAKAVFNEVSNGVQVDLTLTDATPHQGYRYFVWAIVNFTDAAKNRYVYLGNLTGEDEPFTATLKGSVANQKLGAINALLVTLEHRDAPKDETATPGGVPLFFALGP